MRASCDTSVEDTRIGERIPSNRARKSRRQADVRDHVGVNVHRDATDFAHASVLCVDVHAGIAIRRLVGHGARVSNAVSVAQFLLITTLLSIAGLIATSVAGFVAAPVITRSTFSCAGTVVIGLFSQSMTMFFFIGTGSS